MFYLSCLLFKKMLRIVENFDYDCYKINLFDMYYSY